MRLNTGERPTENSQCCNCGPCEHCTKWFDEDDKVDNKYCKECWEKLFGQAATVIAASDTTTLAASDAVTFAASDAAINSAAQDDKATVGCFLEAQEIAAVQ